MAHSDLDLESGNHGASHPLKEDNAAAAAVAAAHGSKPPPVSLTFIDIYYTVPTAKKKKGKSGDDGGGGSDGGTGGVPGSGSADPAPGTKAILSPMSGYVPAGTLVAIMGPSGSGKTSLLNVLAGRVSRSGGKKSVLSGKVLVNGRPRDESFKRISAYVMQDDLMFSCLTVYETLLTAAKLRLPASTPLDQKKALVDAVIAELGLFKAKDTPIGDDMTRGVSGGERKRVAIGVELLFSPSLVFLDEPTSGLDSFQALNVMATLSALAEHGRTVVSTIHQPRSSIFALFQDLVLLSEGKMLYFGRAADAVDYFSRLGLQCPENYNPADYFMDVIAVDRRDAAREEESSKRVKLLADSFAPADKARPDLHQKSLDEQAAGGGAYHESRFATTWFTQYVTLAQRSLWQITRNKIPIIIEVGQALVMTAILSALYSGNATGQAAIQNIQGAIFFLSVLLAFNGIFNAITTFPVERAIVNRERASNTYRTSAYYIGKVLTEWPFLIGPTILLILITYWPIGFQRVASKFFLFLLVCVLEFSTMNAVGLLVGASAPTVQIALAFGPLLTVFFMLFGGLYANLASIPAWLRWLRYISPIQWGFSGMCNVQFTGATFDMCSDSGSSAPPQGASAPPSSSSPSSCVLSGEQVLQQLGISQFTIGVCLGALCAMTAGMHVIAFTALQLNGPKFRKLA